MKKKFSFVLAIIMVVCTLAIALVACAPKDPDPFTAVDSSKELGNIWDAWAKEHMNVSGNTLGINANINLKNSDTDMSIALQGGITQEKGVKEVLRLAVANNKKTGDNKNIVDIIINDTDGLFVNIDGLSQKPIKISELKLPSIGNLLKEGLDMSISDILPAIKPAVVELINFALDDSKVTVDPVKNKKEYDVKYTFTVQVDALVNSILDMINLEMSPEVESIVNEVKAMLEDVNLKFTIDTTGNTQTKVKKPAKNAPKYEYKGGKMTDLKIEVEGMTVNATGINLSNTIPSIAIPTDTMDLDTALLTSRLNGTITMKDETGKSVGDYTYTINLDFEPSNKSTYIDSSNKIKTGSPFTLNYSEMGYTNSIEVQVNEQFDIARFNVVMANGKATYSMSTYLTTTITGSTSSIIADEIESVLEDFNTKYDTANATVKLSSGKFGGINFEFTEAGGEKYIHFAIIKIRTGSKDMPIKYNGSKVNGCEKVGYSDSKANGQASGFPIPPIAAKIMYDIDVWGYYSNDKGSVGPTDGFSEKVLEKLYVELREGRA